MSTKRIIVVIIVILVAFIIWRFFFSPSAQIDRTIKQAREAIEQGDIEGCMKYVSLRYQDSFGHNYKGLKPALSQAFKGTEKTGIFIIRKKKKFLPLQQCEVTMLVIINTASAEFGVVRGREFIRLSMVREVDKIWRCLKAEILERDPFEPQGLASPKEVL
ncbi:MAG: hypothetical protein V1653_01655 [bacterium]